MKSVFRPLFASCFLLSAGCSTLSASSEPASEKSCLQAQDLHGHQLCLDQKNSCPIVVKLMASWCDTCTIEMQSFEKAFDQVPSGSRPQVLVLGVMDSEDALLAYTKHIASPFLFGLDSEGYYQSKLALMAIPGTTVIDRQGNMIPFKDPFSGETTNLLTGPRDWTVEKAGAFLKGVCSLKAVPEPGKS